MKKRCKGVEGGGGGGEENISTCRCYEHNDVNVIVKMTQEYE